MAQKTHIANTASSTAMTWNEFASNVNNGTTYEGITVYLDENITATTRVGSGETKCFKGTFDGQGHTITFTFNSSAQYAAPFAYVEAATFQNLKVTGTITTNFMNAGGFVGRNVTGNTTFINCESNVTINSSYSGDTALGGFVGSNNGMVTFDGCAFTGRLLGSASYAIGGFVGWTLKNSGTGVQFTNCVFAPTEITVDLAAGGTFARYNPDYSTASFTNCYYTQTLGTAQGKQRYTITGQSPVIVALNGTATNHSVSHITAYSGTPGLLYNGTIIAGEGDPVILNLDGYDIGYVADHGTLGRGARGSGLPSPARRLFCGACFVETTIYRVSTFLSSVQPLCVIARHEANRRFDEVNPVNLHFWIASSFLLAMTQSVCGGEAQ